ncbi:MAG: ATP-binding protein [bacterium]
MPKRIAKATQKIIGMKTGMGVPITIRGKVEGVIMFAIKRKIEEIGQRDKEIMMAFANHLGLTIENSRLFEEAAQKGRQLQKTNKKLVEIAEAKSNFLAIASHQLRTPVSIAKDFPKLFKKISRLPNAISVRPDGTGLGLYLVKKIVKAHGGKVDVKSNGVNGEGSEFGFWLPMG